MDKFKIWLKQFFCVHKIVFLKFDDFLSTGNDVMTSNDMVCKKCGKVYE